MKTAIGILIAGIAIAGIVLLATRSPSLQEANGTSPQNVRIENGTQIVEIGVRGGYQPRTSVAKAGLPTAVRFVTNGTFDCSSFIRIPSLNISRALPNTGQTDVSIGTSTAGALQGMCGMGMYRFTIDFQ